MKEIVENIFKKHLKGLYLYGSSVITGIGKYSDIDYFVVIDQKSTDDQKRLLVEHLLELSGSQPIEVTVVVESEINPWKYPPSFDFQYGEWMRDDFAGGNMEPWQGKEMPDLAILLTQIRLAHKTLMGPDPTTLLPEVPVNDFMNALGSHVTELHNNLDGDTRNVLLTLARIWHTKETNTIGSKGNAAEWAIPKMPEELRPPLAHALDIYKGTEPNDWEPYAEALKPCADFLTSQIETVHPNTSTPISLA